MKNEIRLALLCLAVGSAPAFAQGSTSCTSTNWNQSRNMFTISNPASGAVNQQCFVTVAPSSDTTAEFREGTYEIELSGGGGGGGGASLFNSGGGGSGAVPSKITRYLSPGVYRLTIGTGGQAGGSSGGNNNNTSAGGDGNPTSMSNAHTNETIAGFAGAENYTGSYGRGSQLSGFMGRGASGNGAGANGAAGQSSGGDGGRDDDKGRPIAQAQDGGMLKVAGYNAPGGKAGANTGGGGGGAGYGPGGDGATHQSDGSRGGDGFIALRPLQIAQAPAQTFAPAAPAYVAPLAPVEQPAPVTKPRKDRG